jgi:hypothetical protein
LRLNRSSKQHSYAVTEPTTTADIPPQFAGPKYAAYLIRKVDALKSQKAAYVGSPEPFPEYCDEEPRPPPEERAESDLSELSESPASTSAHAELSEPAETEDASAFLSNEAEQNRPDELEPELYRAEHSEDVAASANAEQDAFNSDQPDEVADAGNSDGPSALDDGAGPEEAEPATVNLDGAEQFQGDAGAEQLEDVAVSSGAGDGLQDGSGPGEPGVNESREAERDPADPDEPEQPESADQEERSDGGEAVDGGETGEAVAQYDAQAVPHDGVGSPVEEEEEEEPKDSVEGG